MTALEWMGGREIQINILVHIINAPPTSSPPLARLLGIIRYTSCCHDTIMLVGLHAGMQIHIRPVARGDKNYVRAIVNQHVTSPAGD